MDLGAVVWADRIMVASVFMGTGTWKLVHPGRFRAAVAELVPQLPRRIGRAWAVLPALEIVCGLALLAPEPTSRLAAVIALGLVSAFTYALVRAPGVRHCGCWLESDLADDAAFHRRVLLARNATIFALAIPLLVVAPAYGVAAIAVGTIAGPLFALLLMDLPQIAAVATFTSLPPSQPQDHVGAAG